MRRYSSFRRVFCTTKNWTLRNLDAALQRKPMRSRAADTHDAALDQTDTPLKREGRYAAQQRKVATGSAPPKTGIWPLVLEFTGQRNPCPTTSRCKKRRCFTRVPTSRRCALTPLTHRSLNDPWCGLVHRLEAAPRSGGRNVKHLQSRAVQDLMPLTEHDPVKQSEHLYR